jgi:hypothetical protein
MAIPDFFQEFLTFFIQENSKIPNLKYDVIWKTAIRTKRYQMQLSNLYVAKVMVIPDFFGEFFEFSFKKFPKFETLSIKSYGKLHN